MGTWSPVERLIPDDELNRQLAEQTDHLIESSRQLLHELDDRLTGGTGSDAER